MDLAAMFSKISLLSRSGQIGLPFVSPHHSPKRDPFAFSAIDSAAARFLSLSECGFFAWDTCVTIGFLDLALDIHWAGGW